MVVRHSATTSINPGAGGERLRKLPGLLAILRGTVARARSRGAGAGLLYLRCQLANYRDRLRGGTSYYCNACERRVPWFVHMSNSQWITWRSACPYCDSRKRHRGLIFLYRRILEAMPVGIRVLHFAPEPVFYPLFRNAGCRYETTDYLLEDVDHPNQDIQHLDFADGSFDLVLCNHVIEHVPEDDAAFRELARILRAAGKAIITIPGKWDREDTVEFPDLSNNGHYRDYGLEVTQRLRSAFSEVEVIDLYDEAGRDAERLGLDRLHDIAFVCHRAATLS